MLPKADIFIFSKIRPLLLGIRDWQLDSGQTIHDGLQPDTKYTLSTKDCPSRLVRYNKSPVSFTGVVLE